MIDYKKRYYELLEEVAETNKENRVLRDRLNRLIKEKEEMSKSIVENPYSITEITEFPYGTRFERIDTGTIYTIKESIRILLPTGNTERPAITKDMLTAKFRLV